MKIETERLTIRHFAMTDCEAAYGYLSDQKTMRYIERPYDERHVRSFVFRQCRDTPEVYALVKRETGELIGHVIWHEVGDPAVYELGWVLGSGFWRQGYAEEAGRALIDNGFKKAGLHRIFAETLEENEGCRALLGKLGFEQEGALRLGAKGPYGWEDMLLFGMINPEEK